jgi:hypothetical protein
MHAKAHQNHMITCQVDECERGGQRLRRATLQHVQRDVRREDAVRAAGHGVCLCGLCLPAVQAPLQQLHRFRGCSASAKAALKRVSPGLDMPAHDRHCRCQFISPGEYQVGVHTV